MITTPAAAMAAYFEAKDHNRPHRLDRAFSADARLRMQVHTDAIAFPPLTVGREAIGDLLVRRFAQQYENVYSLCFGDPPPDNARRHACAWMVAMSERQSGQARIGCGRYDWTFDAASGLVRAFEIRIDAMQVLPAAQAQPLLAWASALPAPWCPTVRELQPMPAAPELHAWHDTLLTAIDECEGRPPLR